MPVFLHSFSRGCVLQFLRRWLKPLDVSNQPALQQWRQQVLTLLLRVTAIFALPVVILDFITVLKGDGPFPSVLYTLGYLVLVALTVIPRSPYMLRISYFMLLLFLIGTSELQIYGLTVPGMLMLLATVVLAVLFLGLPGMLLASVGIGTVMTTSLLFTYQTREPILLAIDVTIFVLLATMISTLLLHMMHSLLATITRAEHNALQAQHALQQSMHDPLTGMHNRRYLDAVLPHLVQQAQHQAQPISVIALDVDYFKRFNDTFGHPAGDALLRAMGVFLASSIHDEELACRYGGEEFVLVLPGTPADAALRRAEQLRAGATQIRVQYDGRVLDPITLSLGVACCPDHATTAEGIIRVADDALYAAKRGGRNRVELASEPVALAL